MRKRYAYRLTPLLTSVLFFIPAACTRVASQTYYANNEIHVHDLPVLTARSHDRTDVLLASLDTILHNPDLCCGKDSALIDSASAADPRSLEDIAKKLDGRHLLGDGRPIMMKAEYIKPEQVSAGNLILRISENHAALMMWNSHIYVMYGLAFQESPDYSGQAIAYVIQKFQLLDVRFSDSRYQLEFDRQMEDPSKVAGLLFLTLAGQ